MLFSASTDKTVGVWDSETGERIKRLKGHTSFVNTCYPARRGPQLICTGSDDGTVKVSFPALFLSTSSGLDATFLAHRIKHEGLIVLSV